MWRLPFTPHFKLLGEVGVTRRSVDGQAEQTLNKVTIAPTILVGQDFCSRPEVRLFVTRVNWNDAAQAANATGFGAGGKTSTTSVGVQYKICWLLLDFSRGDVSQGGRKVALF